MKVIGDFGIKEIEIIQYAFKVANAIGIEYGPIHGEFLVDENGPVLVEVNCRVPGAKLPEDFLNRLFHHHHTDIVLDCYLNPAKFEIFKNKPFELNEYGIIKFISVPKDIVAESVPLTHISNKLQSHHISRIPTFNEENNLFVETYDLNSIFSSVYLINTNKKILNKDFEFLNDLEKNAFSQILSDGLNKRKTLNPDDSVNELENILDIVKYYSPTLIVTDLFIENDNVTQCSIENLDDVSNHFDSIIINLNKSLIKLNDEEIANIIFNICDKLKHGGVIFIPESTYQYIANGRNGIEALLLSLYFKLQVPSEHIQNTVVAINK